MLVSGVENWCLYYYQGGGVGREGQHVFCFERNDALGLLDLVDWAFFNFIFLLEFILVLID